MKMTVFVHARADEYSKEGFSYSIFNCDMTRCCPDYKLLAKAEINVDVSGFDARAHLLDTLKKKKDAVIKQATAEAAQLEEKIQQLLALDAPA